MRERLNSFAQLKTVGIFLELDRAERMGIPVAEARAMVEQSVTQDHAPQTILSELLEVASAMNGHPVLKGAELAQVAERVFK